MARYHDGQEVRLGDIVRIGGCSEGVVVCGIDNRQGTAEQPLEAWSYLERGAMFRFERMGLVHYEADVEADVVLVSRASR